MSRATKLVDLSIDGAQKHVVIYELQVKHVTTLLPLWGDLVDNFSVKKAQEVFNQVLFNCTDLDARKFNDLSFSELDKIEVAFKEINAPFLRRCSQGMDLSKTLGVDKIVGKIKDWVVKNVSNRLTNAGGIFEEEVKEEVEIGSKGKVLQL